MVWPFSTSTTASTTQYSTTASNKPNNSPSKSQASTQKTPDQLRSADRALNHKELNIVLNDTGRAIRNAIDRG